MQPLQRRREKNTQVILAPLHRHEKRIVHVYTFFFHRLFKRSELYFYSGASQIKAKLELKIQKISCDVFLSVRIEFSAAATGCTMKAVYYLCKFEFII